LSQYSVMELFLLSLFLPLFTLFSGKQSSNPKTILT
jgi:hypothetical protein